MNKERALYLIQRYRDQTITEAERMELGQWMEEHKDSTLITEAIEQDMQLNAQAKTYDTETLERMFTKVMAVDRTEEDRRQVIPGAARRVVRMWKWVAAASVILIASILVIVSLTKNDNGSTTPLAKTNDVQAPQNTRAVITLADGSKVYLDSAGNGILAQENNVNVVRNEDGIISYELNRQDAKTQGVTAYNTLFNPGGSKVISLTLSDGTKVWLNSESSLKYPIAFAGNTREVEITGEAYFEVKHKSRQPFKVHLPNGSIVEDLGTAFNINSYADESDIKTTLIEGSVKVTGPKSQVTLKPGQQAAINTFNLQLLTFNSVNLEEVTAWKNGIFQFKAAGIETVMRQIARWYDVDVVYGDKVNQVFYGTIPREVSAANVFKVLEETGGVHFRIEGKKVTVLK